MLISVKWYGINNYYFKISIIIFSKINHLQSALRALFSNATSHFLIFLLGIGVASANGDFLLEFAVLFGEAIVFFSQIIGLFFQRGLVLDFGRKLVFQFFQFVFQLSYLIKKYDKNLFHYHFDTIN